MIEKTLLFIGGPIDVGGAGKMIKFVANSCSPYYKKVILYSIEQDKRPFDLDTSVEFISNPFEATNTNGWRIRTMIEIRRKVKNIEPDFICSFTSETATWVRIATLGLRAKVCSAERGDPYTLPLLWKKIAKWVFRKSDACFFQLAAAQDFYGSTVKQKSFVIPNPFILSSEVPVYKGRRNKTIVSAGRFVIEKGYDTLIKAFSIIEPKHPGYRLIIYGEGPLLIEYKQLIESLGLSEKVSFPGYSNNVADSVKEDGIFVLSSRYEGIPNVLIEALSVGIPSIATDCSPGGPRFLMDNGRRGLIVRIDDVEGMAEAILELIENKDLYNQFEMRGPEVRTLLSRDKIASLWMEAINKILAINV